MRNNKRIYNFSKGLFNFMTRYLSAQIFKERFVGKKLIVVYIFYTRIFLDSSSRTGKNDKNK